MSQLSRILVFTSDICNKYLCSINSKRRITECNFQYKDNAKKRSLCIILLFYQQIKLQYIIYHMMIAAYLN